MKKIPTIFKRQAANNGKISREYVPEVHKLMFMDAVATEKIDGTNVRMTIRKGTVVRAEKRRNPDKIQKAKGITEPWYVDADQYGPQDKYVYDGITNTDFSKIPDGEWSGELVGPDIQGNPLNLEKNQIIFFTLGQAPTFENVPTTYDELAAWLPVQKSKIGRECGIEGIVWHCPDGSMMKIKTSDFKNDPRNPEQSGS